MPLDASREGMQLNNQPEPSRLLHPEWPFRAADRGKLERLLGAKSPLDVIVQDFVAPFRADRSVVAIVPLTPKGNDAIAAMFTPAGEKGPIYGGLAKAPKGGFQYFRGGTLS